MKALPRAPGMASSILQQRAAAQTSSRRPGQPRTGRAISSYDFKLSSSKTTPQLVVILYIFCSLRHFTQSAGSFAQKLSMGRLNGDWRQTPY